MLLKIDTDGTQFRVAGPVRPKQDYKDNVVVFAHLTSSRHT